MKKLLLICASAVMMTLGACQKESAQSTECTSSFTIQLPNAQTKAISEGDHTDIVYYEVWNAAGTECFISSSSPISGGSLKLDLILLKNNTYQVIFWAQTDMADSPYSWTNLRRIDVDYAKFKESNKDCYDAFYACEQITIDGQPKNIFLTRPFAQLNFGTKRNSTTVGKLNFTGNTVTVSDVATSFDTVTGKSLLSLQPNPVTFTASAGLVSGNAPVEDKDDSKDLVIGSNSYYWVAMNYLLPTGSNVNVVATFSTSIGSVSHDVKEVPLTKNYRTNIVGDLFTNDAQLIIKVLPGFEGDNNRVI